MTGQDLGGGVAAAELEAPQTFLTNAPHEASHQEGGQWGEGQEPRATSPGHLSPPPPFP